jgi:hypothetical protein
MPIGFALAETGRTRKLYGASTGAHQFQRSSVVERSAVNRLVVGSNPTAGALQNYHTAEPTRTKQERLEFGMAVFHKRVNQNIRLESPRTLNCSLSEDYDFPSAVGSVLA